MESTPHELLRAWESFYLIAGGSAGALTGLQFVVIALIADTPEIGAADSIDAFGTPTVFHFCLCLLVSALMAAPWPSVGLLASILASAGVVGVIYSILVVRRARRQSDYQPVGEDWVWHAILPLMAYGALIGGAIGLARGAHLALFPVGGAALALIFVGIHNAWDAVAYIAVQHRLKSRG